MGGRHEVIDLTSDTDDAGSDLQVTKLPSSESKKGNGGWRTGVIPSNHGLPDPEEFRSSGRKASSPLITQSAGARNRHLPSDSPTDSPKVPWQPAFGVQRSNNPPEMQAQYAPILPGSTVQSRQGSRNYLNGSTGIPPLAHSGTALGKLETAQSGQHSQLTRNPVSTSRRSESREIQRPSNAQTSNGHLHNDEDPSSTYSPLKPTLQPSSQPSDLKRRKVTGSFRPQSSSSSPAFTSHPAAPASKGKERPIVPVSKTVITGMNRIVDSASQNGYPGKAVQSRQAEATEWHRTLETQVLPHVKKAVKRLKDEHSLSHAEAQEIGLEALNAIVKSPGFIQHLEDNNHKLTAEYEQKVARIVDLTVERRLRAVSPRAQHESSSTFHSAGVEVNHENSTPGDSPDSVEIFENPHELQKGMRRSSARDTSSPATSFDNSRAQSQQVSENDDMDIPNKGPRRSYPRRANAQGKDYRLFGRRGTPTSTKQRSKKSTPQASSYHENTKRQRLVPPEKYLHVAVEVPSKQHGDQHVTSKEDKGKVAVVKRSRTKGNLLPAQLPPPAKARLRTAPSAIDQIQAIFRHRELHGLVPVGLRSGRVSYKTLASNALEDSLVRDREWLCQSSDVVTITWTSQSTFVSGALTHYDVHNMQYNRYGNLAVGSTSSRVVKMVDGHRTLRPVVSSEENKENSLPAMRATQDQWRYAPVVSSAHCDVNGYTFTASYDKTVKIWKVDEPGPAMELKGIWEHDVAVNFVVTSTHHDKVATASEAHKDAVRVYMFDESDISQSAYDVYNADRALLRPGDLRVAENWAYHPATLQWARAEQVSDLLLVGYSPRSTNSEDAIPDTKKNSGELCCWNTATGEQIHINASKSQNVFEVIWHPSQPMFLVAMAPAGTYDTKRTKTQVRLFQLQGKPGFESFQCVKTLDCPAADVNELTIMPTSVFGGYVTASCTDGRTYVWDTMHEDRILHVLAHGESIDNPDPDLPLEQADSGVKFAAWGQSPNRFYTGSSDGVVKVWDITRPKRTLLRDIFQAPGGIACGIFSRDFLQLLIGDATGHLHLIRALDEDDPDHDDTKPRNPLVMPPWKRFIVPHVDPTGPLDLHHDAMQVDAVVLQHRSYFEGGVLREYPMNLPGFEHRKRVCQGPRYADLGLYRDEFHVDGDPSKPLLPEVVENTKNHQARIKQSLPQAGAFHELPRVKSTLKRRQGNEDLDLNLDLLLISNPSKEFRKDLEMSTEYIFDFEDSFGLERLFE